MMIDSPAEIARVREVLGQWVVAFNAKNIPALLALYDPDVIYANATLPLQQGLEDVGAWYAGAVPNIQGTLRYKEEAAWQSGNLAAIFGSYLFEPPVDAAPTDVEAATGRVMLMFAKNADGDWKMAFDMDNTPSDVTPEMFD